MKDYSAGGSNASGSATKTLLTIINSASVRARLYDLTIGDSATPADNAAQYKAAKFTAAGTAGNSPTPTPLDNGDVAAIATAGAAHSVEPTYGATLLDRISLNMRATFRWVAWQLGKELVAPATAANGIGIQLVAASAAMVADATGIWYE
jgi:hypothetical protein